MRIAGANDRWRPSDLPLRRVYGGGGWVHGFRARLAVQSGVGRAGPRRDAAVVVDSGDARLTYAGTIGAITDCAGSYVKLRYHLPATVKATGPKDGEVWFARTCGDQRTTYDLPPDAGRPLPLEGHGRAFSPNPSRDTPRAGCRPVQGAARAQIHAYPRTSALSELLK
ncbi:hypothetical protein KZX46_04375 [Polymorphobacter sp. PAMC 29334]|uniref:hypothetical protein n=1 Tax=Polymorphobacter sp. PAMC 29334 TaxID=2862331 RepID=UPI001C75DC5A|nr:hypothetical protein [Polymorphobacter sp. PAMC 29334]QYE35243.1 hypothetical protein KZX46_04375 [Polymorphobacter sp. PAMC 29334]